MRVRLGKPKAENLNDAKLKISQAPRCALAKVKKEHGVPVPQSKK
jgi:hypothetical protein